MLEMLKKLIKSEKTGEIAKNRLKIVIMQDRTTFTPMVMERLKSDLIEVFSRYIEIEENGLDFKVDQENENVGLSISVPIKKVKSDEEINRNIINRI